uniref:Large ribosomal subunit protein mL50 n=1 Tax=Corethrella appendiculata TaxID=1370023 RepID=U5ENH7_9DIPT
MAAITKNIPRRIFSNYQSIRFYASSNRVKRIVKKPLRKIEGQLQSTVESLASRGYLRAYKEYEPSSDVADKINEICAINNVNSADKKFRDLEEKFQFLKACTQAFNHSIPNSQLYEIENVADVIKFYRTPVDTTLPLDGLKTVELPENLHIQHEYVRFNPETDTMFGGKTAFPKSSQIVTGLKYKDKYKGFLAKKSWP